MSQGKAVPRRQPPRRAPERVRAPIEPPSRFPIGSAPPPRALSSAGWALLPLRGFLGFTFCFAGLQKLANPAFFNASSPASIQSQLAGAARRSPIHALIGPLVHVAVPLGVLIALAEIAIGVGTLAGLWTRAAAVGGTLLSFGLFLTISFHSNPYYTGSDIVFVFAWLPLILAGAGGALSADAAIAALVRRREGAAPADIVPIPFATVRQVCGSFDDGRCAARRGAACEPAPCPFLAAEPAAPSRAVGREIDRRTFAASGALAAMAAGAALVAGAIAAGMGRLIGGSNAGTTTRQLGSAPTASTTASTAPSTAPTTAATATSGPTTTAPHPAGTRIGPASDVPVGGSASFNDPSTGDPSLVIQPQAGTFLAFDSVCPHAGCIVQYDPNNSVFICPCHGSQFNGRTGAVEVGPSPTGLGSIGIKEGSDGQLYVT
ncbi:MAG TPA: Rieske 2Fe-2S domain-containing protein [Acidimicrobiales bacterium]|nr:Rieske 2Fe-2S domain-containing protein [Acidimicrobiales bacterium]